MTETSNTETLRERWDRWIGPVLVGVLVVLGAYELLVAGGGESAAGTSVPSVQLEEAERDRGLQFAYGLTPVDLGRIADAALERDAPYIVAGYPGTSPNYEELPDGPVLTRSPNAESAWPGGEGSRRALQDLDGPWRELVVSAPRGEPKRRPTLAAAQVRVRSDGDLEPCPRYGVHRFRCATAKWAEVRWRKLQIGGSKQRCIWTHPLSARTVVFDFGTVDPASSRGYRLRTGLRDSIAGGGADVDVKVVRGGETVSHAHTPGKGWQELQLPAVDEPAPLSIEISSENVGQRHFCFLVRDG